jgi:solute carrier family 35 protein
MLHKKITSALFYALASMMIIFANKIVLTSYKFSSFQTLAIGQLLITLVIFQFAEFFKIVNVAKFDPNIGLKLLPLAIIYFGNLLFGLGGTKSLNLPMFTVLRRFSILMTLYGELYILRNKKSLIIQLSIYLMVFGAIIAALDDLTFDFYGYVFIMLNNFFTAANGIYTKKKLNSSILNEFDILYYNALFALVPMIVLSFYSGEVEKLKNYDGWSSPGFWFFFVISSLMAFVLNYSWMLCTKYNSPLTTTVIGCLKHICQCILFIFNVHSKSNTDSKVCRYIT